MRKQNRAVHFDKDGRYVDSDKLPQKPQRQEMDELTAAPHTASYFVTATGVLSSILSACPILIACSSTSRSPRRFSSPPPFN